MKTSKKIIWIFVIAMFFCVPKTFAIDIDLFPNTNTVQPLPNGSLPNISGNIDWPEVPGETSTDGDTSDGSDDTDESPYDIDISNPTTDDGSNTDTSSSATNGGSGAAGDNSGTPGGYPSSGNNANGGDSSSGSSFYNLLTNLFGKENTSGTSGTSVDSNKEAPNTLEIDQILMNEGQIQRQRAVTESNFAWAIAFGSMILLAAAFVLWRLKKNPNDVNPTK